MREEVENAAKYANDSNKLENNPLTKEEVDILIETINDSDEAFTDTVLEMIDKDKKKEESSNVKVRK